MFVSKTKREKVRETEVRGAGLYDELAAAEGSRIASGSDSGVGRGDSGGSGAIDL